MNEQRSNDAGKGELANAPRLWMRAVREGWSVPDVAKRAAIARAAQILADPNASRREVTRATQTLAILERLAIDAAVHEDRMTRLDAGTATDRVEVSEAVTDKQLQAVAALLKPKPVPQPEPPLLPTKRKARKGKA